MHICCIKKALQTEVDILGTVKNEKHEQLKSYKKLYLLCVIPVVKLVISMQVIKQLHWIWVTSASEQLDGTAYFHNERTDLISLFSHWKFIKWCIH